MVEVDRHARPPPALTGDELFLAKQEVNKVAMDWHSIRVKKKPKQSLMQKLEGVKKHLLDEEEPGEDHPYAKFRVKYQRVELKQMTAPKFFRWIEDKYSHTAVLKMVPMMVCCFASEEVRRLLIENLNASSRKSAQASWGKAEAYARERSHKHLNHQSAGRLAAAKLAAQHRPQHVLPDGKRETLEHRVPAEAVGAHDRLVPWCSIVDHRTTGKQLRRAPAVDRVRGAGACAGTRPQVPLPDPHLPLHLPTPDSRSPPLQLSHIKHFAWKNSPSQLRTDTTSKISAPVAASP